MGAEDSQGTESIHRQSGGRATKRASSNVGQSANWKGFTGFRVWMQIFVKTTHNCAITSDVSPVKTTGDIESVVRAKVGVHEEDKDMTSVKAVLRDSDGVEEVRHRGWVHGAHDEKSVLRRKPQEHKKTSSRSSRTKRKKEETRKTQRLGGA